MRQTIFSTYSGNQKVDEVMKKPEHSRSWKREKINALLMQVGNHGPLDVHFSS